LQASGYLSVLPRADVEELADNALVYSSCHLRRLQPDSAAHVVEETVEWWRLMDAILRHAAGGAPVGAMAHIAALQEMVLDQGDRDAHGAAGVPLPAAPPPSVAAALAGGFLPCLERLLRRTGADFNSREAVMVERLLGRSNCPQWLFALLAYGE
ncbi:hypothetical protein Agub_g6185, partial [Astrephomene gubernaculifera]